MKKKYIKPNIRIHQIEGSLLAGSNVPVTTSYRTTGAFAKGHGGLFDDDDE